MPTCPRCGNKCDNDFFKERGLCSECGFSIQKVSSSKVSIDKYNASVRKNANTTERTSSQTQLKKVSADSLKKKSSLSKPANTQQISKSKQVVTAPPDKEKAKRSQTDVQPVQTSLKAEHDPYTDPIFDSEKMESVAIPEESTDIEEIITDNVDLSDPIFVNATGPLSFDDNEEEVDDETPEQAAKNRSSRYEEKNIKVIDEDIPPNINKFLLPFFYLKKICMKRKNLRLEHLEAIVDYDFNHDGFYNDTVPVSPYEIDAINKKTVMKVVAAVIGVFAFIAFIIYYA